jgi:broad specificity phosphatase PhoE
MRGALLAGLVLSLSLPAAADVFLVRHAEKLSPKMDASLLSPAGLKRARTLARVLADVPLKAVYCTEYERTRQTAAPAAAEHGLKPVAWSSDDAKGLAARLKAAPPGEDALVVGHSDTIPDLLFDLGVATRVALGAAEYDDLFVVTFSSGAAPRLHRLHY